MCIYVQNLVYFQVCISNVCSNHYIIAVCIPCKTFTASLWGRIRYRPLWYERVYAPLHEVAHTPFHIQGKDIL